MLHVPSSLCVFTDAASEETMSPPCYHGNLAPSDLSHTLVLTPENFVQSLDGSHNTSTSDTFLAPKLSTNFPSFKTAERKELSKVRRVPKRVMFSDDLENSQSSGRSSTMSSSYSDINHVPAQNIPRIHRPYSIDLDHNTSQPYSKDLRYSADNLSYHGNNFHSNVLPSYPNFVSKNNNTHDKKQFLNSDKKLSSFNGSHSYQPEFIKSLSSPGESTTTSGSYCLTLDEPSSSLSYDVFAKDLFV